MTPSLIDTRLKQLERAIRDIFGQAGVPSGAYDRTEDSRGADLIFEAGEPSEIFVVEFKTSARQSTMRQAVEQARLAAQFQEARPVVAAPYISPTLGEMLAEEEINYVDLSGNARISGAGFHVYVSGRPNKFPERGRPSSPFTPASSRIARTLLTHPDRWWLQVDLVDATTLSEGQVSKVVKRLKELQLVIEREDRSIRAENPESLLEAWSIEYPRFASNTWIDGHATGNGIDLARTLQTQLNSVQSIHAFTGFPAAWAYDHFTTFRLVTVFANDIETVADRLELRRESRGANVRLIEPNDPGVFYASREVDGIWCVSPVQTYMDLSLLPERSEEARLHLRPLGRNL